MPKLLRWKKRNSCEGMEEKKGYDRNNYSQPL